MKILTPEEEAAHNKAIWEGGIMGGLAGLAIGGVGVYAATARSHAFRQLSAPFRVFLVTGTTCFAAVISADRYSRNFEKSRHADADYRSKSEEAAAQAAQQKTTSERIKAWVSEQRYPIVFGSWVVGMAASGALVSRNKFLTGQQKLVQARVYAQALTLAVLVASFALEGNDLRAGKGRWETIKILDPDDPEHKRVIEKKIHHEKYTGEDQWMDMIEAEERKMKERGQNVRASRKKSSKGSDADADADENGDASKSEKSDSDNIDGNGNGNGSKQKKKTKSS